MKKIFFALLAIMCISLGTYATESSASVEDASACITVGNVSANVMGSRVIFTNYNDYRVTVSYEVIGYAEDGRQQVVGSGTITLSKYGSGSPSVSFTPVPNIQSYGVNINVQKCS